jgi:hypothetical protein
MGKTKMSLEVAEVTPWCSSKIEEIRGKKQPKIRRCHQSIVKLRLISACLIKTMNEIHVKNVLYSG